MDNNTQMMDMLFERMEENLYAEFTKMVLAGDTSKEKMAYFTNLVHAYIHFTNDHAFQINELEALLDFERPLIVAQEIFNAAEDRWELSVCDELEKIEAYTGYELVSDAQEEAANNLKTLMDRLDNNLAEYRHKCEKLSVNDLIDKAEDISATFNTYHYLKDQYCPVAAEVLHLLEFQNPLEVVTQYWSSRSHELIDLSFVMEGVLEDQSRNLKSFPLVKDAVSRQDNRSPFPIELESGYMYIFQVKGDEEHSHLRNAGYNFYESAGWECNAGDYDLVHTETLGSVRELDEYFEKAAIQFKHMIPEGFAGRPVEIGDIVVLTPNGEAHALFNEGSGFYEKVDYFLGQIASNVEFSGPETAVLKNSRKEEEKSKTVPVATEGGQKPSIQQWLKKQMDKPGQPAPASTPKHIRKDEPR